MSEPITSWDLVPVKRQLQRAWGTIEVTDEEVAAVMHYEPETPQSVGELGVSYAGEVNVVVRPDPEIAAVLGRFSVKD